MVIDKKLLILIGLTVLIVVLMRIGCGGLGDFSLFKPLPPPEIIRDTVKTVEYDTITLLKEKYIPKIQKVEVIKWRDIPQNIDTSAILQKYYSSNIYVDTLIYTDSVKIIVNDTISKNKIQSRSFQYSILHPHTTNTITEKTFINRREVYFGGRLDFFKQNQIKFSGGSASLLLRTKRNMLLGVSGGLNSNFNVTFGVGVYYKLRLKKPN